MPADPAKRRKKKPRDLKIVIRSETDPDVNAITEVTVGALRPWRSAITMILKFF
jgi:hypothetical protein